MAQGETVQQVYERFSEYCAGYMQGEDADTTGITVIIHPMYRLIALASKGPFLQKERLGRAVNLFAAENYEPRAVKDIPDLSGSGMYTGVVLLRDKSEIFNASQRYLNAVKTFHRPHEELLKTIDESFVMAKLMEYEVLQNGDIRIAETQVPESAGDGLPPSVTRLNGWLDLIASGGSSTCSLRHTEKRVVLTPMPGALREFSRELIAVMKDTQDLWARRPKREEELVSLIEAALSSEKVDIPEEAEETSKILSMGRRESDSYFRERREHSAEEEFDPLNMLEAVPVQGRHNDLANNRFGMDPFRRMNVNEIFFFSEVL